jgi:hypothetical protein
VREKKQSNRTRIESKIYVIEPKLLTCFSNSGSYLDSRGQRERERERREREEREREER